MDSILNYLNTLFGKKPTTIFLRLALLVYFIFLFEQYTGHFRLTRIEKVTTIAVSSTTAETKRSLQNEASRLTKSYVSQIKNRQKWFYRLLGGALPFLLLTLQSIRDKDYWNSIQQACTGAGFGGLLALLPDFLPNSYWCAGASTVFIVSIISFSLADLGHPESLE